MTAHPLTDRWRQEAALLRRHGAIEAATTKELCADELAVYQVERGLEHLTLVEAASESGYSAAHISRMLAEGRMENVGVENHPLVRRGDLPRKAPPRPALGPDLVAKVRRAEAGMST